MTIYAAGSELDVWSPLSATCIESTAVAGSWDTVRSRCSIRLGADQVFGPTTGVSSPVLPDLANVWFRAGFFLTFVNSSNLLMEFIEIRNSSGIVMFRISQLALGSSTKSFQAAYWNGSIMVNTGPVFTMNHLMLAFVDLNVNFTTGGFTLYVGGVLYASGSGWTGAGSNRAATVRAYNLTGFGTGSAHMTEGVVADEDTRRFNVVTIPATGAGALTAWAGGVTDINELVLNDSNSISSSVAGDLESFTIATPAISATGIRAVAIGFRGSSSGGAPAQIEGLLRLGGTNFFTAPLNPGAALGGRSLVFDTNPQTTAPFAMGEITTANLQYGFAART